MAMTWVWSVVTHGGDCNNNSSSSSSTHLIRIQGASNQVMFYFHAPTNKIVITRAELILVRSACRVWQGMLAISGWNLRRPDHSLSFSLPHHPTVYLSSTRNYFLCKPAISTWVLAVRSEVTVLWSQIIIANKWIDEKKKQDCYFFLSWPSSRTSRCHIRLGSTTSMAIPFSLYRTTQTLLVKIAWQI